MTQKLTAARKTALRTLHNERERKTAGRLTEALNRMEAGTPDQLVVPFKWTKANLAREASVHVGTILAKNDDGTYRCAAIIDRFEALRANARSAGSDQQSAVETIAITEERLASTRADALEKESELGRQAELICQLRAQLRDYEARDDHVKQLIQANADLRAECRRLQRLPT